MNETLLRLIFLPIVPFVTHPERIAIVAALFVLGYLVLLRTGRYSAWPFMAAAIVWGLWACGSTTALKWGTTFALICYCSIRCSSALPFGP